MRFLVPHLKSFSLWTIPLVLGTASNSLMAQWSIGRNAFRIQRSSFRRACICSWYKKDISLIISINDWAKKCYSVPGITSCRLVNLTLFGMVGGWGVPTLSLNGYSFFKIRAKATKLCDMAITFWQPVSCFLKILCLYFPEFYSFI